MLKIKGRYEVKQYKSLALRHRESLLMEEKFSSIVCLNLKYFKFHPLTDRHSGRLKTDWL